MDDQLIQRSRYVLKTRIRRAKTCPRNLFPSACFHLLNWINNHPVFYGALVILRTNKPGFKEELNNFLRNDKKSDADYEAFKYSATSTIEHSAICLFIIEFIANMSEEEILYSGFFHEITYYLLNNFQHERDEQLETLRNVALDGLYEYLDEQIDGRNVLYGIILKYKQRSEWFRRERLRTLVNQGVEGKSGERALAVDLQEYIFNQGVEFYIEPSSASGEADLIIKAAEGKNNIIDAKYIKPDSTRSEIVRKISSGFHQVFRYCEDYNEYEGYLVTFVNLDKRIDFELEEVDGIKIFRLGSKVIYHLFVDITDSPSASKSGKAEEILIKRDELVKEEKTSM